MVKFDSRSDKKLIAQDQLNGANAAFEKTTRSVGCASVLLPRVKSGFTSWWTSKSKSEKTLSKSKAAGNNRSSTRCSTGQQVEAVQVPTLTADEAWDVMRRRFRVVHDPEVRASSDGVVILGRLPGGARVMENREMWNHVRANT